MKAHKKIALIFMLFALILSVISCGGTEDPCIHEDEDGDYICDLCEEELEPEQEEKPDGTVLVEDSEPLFRFVVYTGAKTQVFETIRKYANVYSDYYGTEIEITRESDTSEFDGVEILVGPVKTRGEDYYVDMYSLGKEGYVMKAVDDKIILCAGSIEAFPETIESFFKTYLGYKDGDSFEPSDNIIVSDDDWKEKIQDNYKISSFTINGNDIKDYVIACNTHVIEFMDSATYLQTVLYEKLGVYLPIEKIDDLSEDELKHAIILRETDNAGNDGYRTKVYGDALVMETEFPIKLYDGVSDFVHLEITTKRDEVNLGPKFEHKCKVRYVYYNDFGAVGDGKTDDSAAIIETHKYANKYGFTVCAGDNTGNTKYTYYIGPTTQTAVIKTNVNWGKATFYLDDKSCEFASTAAKTSIFRFESDYKTESISKEVISTIVNENGGLTNDITKINYKTGNKYLLMIYDANARQYMRYGHFNNGSTQRELVIIDGEGNFVDNTALLFDYAHVTSITAKRVDDKPITASGGIFITDANSVLPEQQYYNSYTRNIVVERSNVTINGLQHKIINEGEHGVPYSGFISMSWANNMLVENTILQGHKVYQDIKDKSWMGTYDIGGSYANGLYFKNCTQSNFFQEGSETATVSGLWGIMGTNYCKNITYDNSTLSRLDAHAGVFNASIINGSKVQMVNLIGGGTALIENSYIYNANGPIDLRADYGSLWNGDIILRNAKLYVYDNSFSFIRPTWRNHNFGYNPSYGHRIIIENLTIMDKPDATMYLIGNPTSAEATSNVKDITADRVPVPNTTNGLFDESGNSKEEKDKQGLYKNYCKVSLPTEIIIVNMPDAYKKNFKISPNENIVKAGLNIKFMTTEEYKEYQKNNSN